MNHTFTLDSVCKTYISQISLVTFRKNSQPQVKKALSGVSITLTPGLYGLLGPNGAGKSTLIHIITGTLAPDSGEVLWCGKPATGIAFRRILGYMPQQQGLYDSYTGRRFLAYMAALKEISRKAVAAEVDRVAAAVNLTAELDKHLSAYSGGMKQRLGIAQAELNDPSILILDEPTAGLDPKERVRFRNIISDFAKEKIVILSTHIVSDVSYIADTILMMKQGRFLLQEPMSTVTDGIRGKVWEVLVNDRDVAEYSRHFCVVNLHHENNKVRLRIVDETAPAVDAYTVEPSLEDLFLYHFGEETQNERGGNDENVG